MSTMDAIWIEYQKFRQYYFESLVTRMVVDAIGRTVFREGGATAPLMCLTCYKIQGPIYKITGHINLDGCQESHT